ncbi:secondary thiamine-phosphate synthase enzyme YjbQ [Patescibacteria group bacterium]|nr:secondary thiamine-phosphate synthase enzyme YjbQ [Patescibacteria group bacterium]
MFVTKTVDILTQEAFQIIDITDQVTDFLEEYKVKNGLLSVFTKHTTAILRINEAEDGLWNDLRKWCDKNVPIDERYQHNDLENRDPKTMCDSKEECLNGHSHIRSMLIGNASETIPILDGKMQL